MEQRELAIIEIRGRIKAIAVDTGLKHLKRTPTAQVGEDNLPAVFIHEGNDEIFKTSNRDWRGFPHYRRVQVLIELWVKDPADIKALYTTVRNEIFAKPLVCGAKLEETGANGPFNNGVPGLLGMQLIMALTYVDYGPQ